MSLDTLVHLQKLGIDKNEIESSLALPAEPFTIFLSGSLIEEFGNAESDLDVFVVYTEEIPAVRSDFNEGTHLISMEFSANWRLDIESWTRENMMATADRINQCALKDLGEFVNLSMEDRLLAHNIRIGIPIQHADHFQQIHQAFDFAHLSRLLTSNSLAYYNNLAEDTAGAIASKQHGAALLMARKTIQFVIDAWLAAQGETNPKDKWRFNKLEKLGNQAMWERYWALETFPLESKNNVFEYAQECLLFAQNIAFEIQRG